ncbi:MAG: hypothetical protein Q7V61_06045 [Actinomycetota bacterium]|nr:hypothetical protein [Actinomycetota bacterium]
MKRHTTFKLVLRLVLLGAVVLTVAGFTTALWSDGATSAGNVYATGDLDLLVRNEGFPDFSDGPVYATWGASNMYPGQQLNWGTIHFLNDGTFEGTTFDIAVSNTCTVEGMDKYIQITRMRYENGHGHDMLSSTDPYCLVNTNETPWIDLDDLEHQPRLALPAPGTSGQLRMDFRFNENAGNAFQAGSVTADFTFTLHQ